MNLLECNIGEVGACMSRDELLGIRGMLEKKMRNQEELIGWTGIRGWDRENDGTVLKI